MKAFLWAGAVIFLLCYESYGQNLTGFKVTDISCNSARATWQTADSASSFIKVFKNSVEVMSTGSDEKDINHEVFLTPLLPLTTYEVEAWSELGDGQWLTSTRKSFMTLDGEIKLTLSLNEEILPDAIVIYSGQNGVPLIKFRVSVNNIESVWLTRLTFHLSVPVDTLVYNFTLKDDQGTIWATQMYSHKMVIDFTQTLIINPGQSINFKVYADVLKMKKYGIFRLTCEPPLDVNASVMSGQTVTVQGKLSGNRFSIEPTTGVSRDVTPSAITLEQNYPNPFSGATTIKYFLPTAQKVSLKVYDILGRCVAVLLDNESRIAGEQQLICSHIDLPPGAYIYRLETATNFIQKQMIILK